MTKLTPFQTKNANVLNSCISHRATSKTIIIPEEPEGCNATHSWPVQTESSCATNLSELFRYRNKTFSEDNTFSKTDNRKGKQTRQHDKNKQRLVPSLQPYQTRLPTSTQKTDKRQNATTNKKHPFNRISMSQPEGRLDP